MCSIVTLTLVCTEIYTTMSLPTAHLERKDTASMVDNLLSLSLSDFLGSGADRPSNIPWINEGRLALQMLQSQ
jgi:hypothetical protein